MGRSKDQEREYARMLYVNEKLSFKATAERVGVTEKTVAKWAELYGWDTLRKSMLTTRLAQLTHWYNQLDAINEEIAKRSPPIPINKEADTMSKITANIKRLETETGLGEYIEVGRKLLVFIQDINLSDAQKFKDYVDEYIMSKLKHS